MLTAAAFTRSLGHSRRSLASYITGSSSWPKQGGYTKNGNDCCVPATTTFSLYSTAPYFANHARSIVPYISSNSSSTQNQQIRTFIPSFSSLPPLEEEKEKSRVASLTPYQKEMELRQLDSEISRLQSLRGINTGELYTMFGKAKFLMKEYGPAYLAYYWTVWFATFGITYAAVEAGGVDPLVVAGKVEAFFGYDGYLTERFDPTIGRIGLIVAANECLEIVRLPFVLCTAKPVIKLFSTKKY